MDCVWNVRELCSKPCFLPMKIERKRRSARFNRRLWKIPRQCFLFGSRLEWQWAQIRLDLGYLFVSKEHVCLSSRTLAVPIYISSRELTPEKRRDTRRRMRETAVVRTQSRSDQTRHARKTIAEWSSARRRELERKGSVLAPASSRLFDRKHSEENTNSLWIFQDVSRFADARKKFVTKATRVQTWRGSFVVEKKKEEGKREKKKWCQVTRRLSFSVESSTISTLRHKRRDAREKENSQREDRSPSLNGSTSWYFENDARRVSTWSSSLFFGVQLADRTPARLQYPDGHYGWHQVPHGTLRRPWYESEVARAQRHAAERFPRSCSE